MKIHTKESSKFETLEQELDEKFRSQKKVLFDLIKKLHTEGYDTEEDQFSDARRIGIIADNCSRIKNDQKKVFEQMINSMKEVEER